MQATTYRIWHFETNLKPDKMHAHFLKISSRQFSYEHNENPKQYLAKKKAQSEREEKVRCPPYTYEY